METMTCPSISSSVCTHPIGEIRPALERVSTCVFSSLKTQVKINRFKMNLNLLKIKCKWKEMDILKVEFIFHSIDN